MDTFVILLHGLGENPITLFPLEKYLNFCGYSNTLRFRYPVDSLDFEDSLDFVDQEISKVVDKENEEIIVIGQSMGGVIANNLHRKGWTIKMAVYIGSPLHGANFLNQLESILPTFIRNFMFKKSYKFLQDKKPEPIPPHKYHTISMSWPFTEFDGCVYKRETILDEKNHTHLRWADHRTIFANPRLWVLVSNTISNEIK
jgi:esterase/lipase